MYKILLGSNSPRRNELLQQLGYDFTKVVIDCNEDFDPEMKPELVAEYLANKKSNAYDKLRGKEVLITADTTVICDGKILNKPLDADEAVEMLSLLNGNTHQVCTGVAFRSLDKGMLSFTCTTSVTIADMDRSEIEYYIRNYKPFDKAGAYGIQEWYGLAQVKSIEGSYYNVVRLPTHEVYQKLKHHYGV